MRLFTFIAALSFSLSLAWAEPASQPRPPGIMGVVLTDTTIARVAPGSPAEKAGLSGATQRVRRGAFVGYARNFSRADFVLAVNGKRVGSRQDVIDQLSKVKPGEEVELVVRRGYRRGKKRTVKVKPELS